MPKYNVSYKVDGGWTPREEFDIEMDAWGLADVVASICREEHGKDYDDIDIEELD